MKRGRKAARSSTGKRRRQKGSFNLSLLIPFLVPLLCLATLWFAPAPPFTLLLLGIDQRPGEVGPARTDAILIAHVGPDARQASLFSVPRDLWLPQPGGINDRINTALGRGFQPDDPHAGPAYLAQTLSDNFAIPIDGYMLISFAGFEEIVDALGGVRVDVPVRIVDESYPTEDYGVRTVVFEPGTQVLNGEDALVYARTRHQDSDFGRSARQQQIMAAIFQRLSSPAGWVRIPAFLPALLDAVETDLSLLDIPGLLHLGRAFASGGFQRIVFDDTYVSPWITESGAYVLLPRWEIIEPMLTIHFAGVRLR